MMLPSITTCSAMFRGVPMRDREYNRRAVEIFRRQKRGTEPPEHGRNGYDNYGCRCTVCSEAKHGRKQHG